MEMCNAMQHFLFGAWAIRRDQSDKRPDLPRMTLQVALPPAHKGQGSNCYGRTVGVPTYFASEKGKGLATGKL